MPKNDVISQSKNILGGVPLFSETRVPMQTFVDYLEAGDRIDDSLEDFPSVTREQAKKVLGRAAEALYNIGRLCESQVESISIT
jgi:uncharacterized protein (DUF433 family)